MNYSLAREIYGLNTWFVDQKTLPSLLGIYQTIQSGVTLELPETKLNTPHVLQVFSNARVIDRPYSDGWAPGQLDNNEDFVGVGIINIDGPITVSGGKSTVGMRSVSELMKKMALDERIVSFIVFSDSGGGASSAVEIMADTILAIKDIKPVYGLIKKGGIAASACYGILSACNAIYAESEMSIVGSAGTMIQFEGREANSQDDSGLKHIRLYAEESTHKNKGFEDALNKDNYKVLQDEFLKPINDSFLSMISKNRPMLVGTDFRNGNTKFAKDSIGTYIDGIKSFENVLEIATNVKVVQDNVSQTGDTSINKVSLTNKNKTMDITELKQNHPELYKSVYESGVSEERDRAGSWMVHAKTDLPAVKSGIKSGEGISATQLQEFLVKASTMAHIENIEVDSAEEIVTPESTTGVEGATSDSDNYKKLKQALNKNK